MYPAPNESVMSTLPEMHAFYTAVMIDPVAIRRSYYRCTHKNYFGCEAKKKVQRLGDNAFMYEVTYCGNHTCLTTTTPLLTLPAIATTDTVTTNSPTSSAAILFQDLAMVAAEYHHPAPALSTAIQLGMSWMPSSSLVGASSSAGPAGEGSSVRVNVATTSGIGTGIEYPVMDLADAMSNSGSSGGSSMDAIFSSHDPRHR
jgi:hypothetical protein